MLFTMMNFQSIRNDFNQQVKEQTGVLEAEQMKVHLAEELERQDILHVRSRRTSSMGVELFQDHAVTKHARAMTVLAEDDEEEESDEQEKSEEQTAAAPVPQGVKEKPETEDKPSPDVKDTDPLAALGDKLAKLRETRSQSTAQQRGSDQQPKPEAQEEYPHDKAKELTNEWITTVQANLVHLKNHPVETLWPRDTLFRYLQLMEAWQENLAERQQLLRLAAQALLRFHDT